MVLAGVAVLCSTGAGYASAHRSATSLTPPNPTQHAFQLSAPGQLAIGPATIRRPACRPGQIAAHAVTRTSAYGVLGVIRLRGTAFHRVQFGSRSLRLRCSLPLRHGPTALLDERGHALAVALGHGNRLSPPSNLRPDIPLTNGVAAWGFSWLGSYCDRAPAALRQPLTRHRSIMVPLTGPTPRCIDGSHSHLLDGIAGRRGDAVQPAPPAFARLRLEMQVSSGTTRRKVADIDATLTTTGDDVVLSPCPFAGGWVMGTANDGQFSSNIPVFQLNCVPDATVVSPTQPVHFVIAGPQLTAGSSRGAKPHSTVTIEIGIAGMPSATVQVRVP